METASNEKQQLTIDVSTTGLIKGIMNHYSASMEAAYQKVMPTTLYRLLCDYETGLCFESEEFLTEACVIELEQGEMAMRKFIVEE